MRTSVGARAGLVECVRNLCTSTREELGGSTRKLLEDVEPRRLVGDLQELVVRLLTGLELLASVSEAQDIELEHLKTTVVQLRQKMGRAPQ